MEDNNKPSKRRNKFAGKEDISRQTIDDITNQQIDQLRDITRRNEETTSIIKENVAILYEKRISVNTDRFEQISQNFVSEMEHKLKKVKQPSKGLKWYILMWSITLFSAFLAGYFIHEYREWKEKATYWYQQYEEKSN